MSLILIPVLACLMVATSTSIKKATSKKLFVYVLITCSCRMIEECMLLANMAVAHKISETFPELALLRRHPPPKGKAIEHLVSERVENEE